VLNVLISYLTIFILTLLGVGLFRRWSLRRDIVDLPNERSSHTRPTPRGGGFIICLVCLSAFFIYSVLVAQKIIWPYFAGALIISAISWIDDLRSVSAVWRFLCHGLAAGLVVWNLGGFNEPLIPFYGLVDLGTFGTIFTFWWIVWLINAYNFMDGIDGIAGTQAVTAGLGWCFIGYSQGAAEIGFYGGAIACAGFAFLQYNWQPAKIFMGDVGSAFLGYTFAVMPLLAATPTEKTKAYFPSIAILLVWFFVFDSVLTFFRRLLRGEKVWRAHREHIYQKLVISGLSHGFVTIVYGIASFLMVILLIFYLEYGGDFEKILALAVLLATISLLAIWRKRKIMA
jgi:Fuc2NAc and GlcNAc transferase